ncbi:MAG: sulfate reduction electron transfer complex DsrMKJOP subunit DsrJ [Proteobacteria bacterium]|nr:sulfate reduction electron transfer complex DsrMKJOP subunit DsrJ [Pseudomonadota bacterium]
MAKSYYLKRTLIGLCAFFGIILAPFAYNQLFAAYQAPEVKLPTEAQMLTAGFGTTTCIENKDFMRQQHMTLLNDWRDWALRDGNRSYVSTDGVEYEISLQRTCMKCHTNKAEFCDKCHTVAAASPYCWDCHIQPEGYNEGN